MGCFRAARRFQSRPTIVIESTFHSNRKSTWIVAGILVSVNRLTGVDFVPECFREGTHSKNQSIF
jgi:hypothetical protein